MAQPELIKDIEARVKDTGDIMTGNLKVPDLDIASDICKGSIYGETNSLNFRGGNPTTEKYTYLKIAEDGAYIDNQKIYYPGNKPTPEDIGAAPASHASDETIHVTAEEKASWNAKVDKPYLTFSSPNSFTLKVNDAKKHWDGTLEYFASNKTWTVWDGTTISSVDYDGEYFLYLRGTGNTVIAGNNTNYKWVLTGSNIACIGNIENLLDYATVASGAHPTMAANCYSRMFLGCSSLTQAPSLPATTLAEMCYSRMFDSCSSLTQAPALPATTLAERCYDGMFYGCTSLTHAPALPATTLAERCYYAMFDNCTSLTHAPSLPAVTLANNCYEAMFQMCSSLTQIPALPATTLANSCYLGMFSNCRSIKLSTTQTGEYTQEYRIPTAGTGTTATDSLRQMFFFTGGTFKETPEINTTYYLSSDNTVIYDTEVSTLIEYVEFVAAQKLKVISITLSASAWDSSTKTQTVTVSGVLADETKQIITPTPALVSQTAYYEAVILCTGQAANQLTFTAKKIPTIDLTVYVTIQEVSA